MNRGRLRRAPEDSLTGLTIVAECYRHGSSSFSSSLQDNNRCLLLLGSLSNALAAASSASASQQLDDGRLVMIRHIVSVADRGKAREVERVLKNNSANTAISFSTFFMADRLSPEIEVDLQEITKKPISAIEEAVGYKMNETIVVKATDIKQQTSSSPTRAVLVHCNQGHNRSPTLVLVYLLCCGMSLREAYRTVLSSRPGVDPLPNYRRALLQFEYRLHGENTVEATEAFHLHMSQLARVVRENGENYGNNASKDGDDDIVAKVYKLRKSSIHELLAE